MLRQDFEHLFTSCFEATSQVLAGFRWLKWDLQKYASQNRERILSKTFDERWINMETRRNAGNRWTLQDEFKRLKLSQEVLRCHLKILIYQRFWYSKRSPIYAIKPDKIIPWYGYICVHRCTVLSNFVHLHLITSCFPLLPLDMNVRLRTRNQRIKFITFAFTQISLGKVWMYLFSLQFMG